MKKQDFINAVRSNSELNVTNKLVGEVIDATFGEISNLIQGETGKFTYPGFGTFFLRPVTHERASTQRPRLRFRFLRRRPSVSSHLPVGKRR